MKTVMLSLLSKQLTCRSEKGESGMPGTHHMARPSPRWGDRLCLAGCSLEQLGVYVLTTGAMCAGTLSSLITSSLATVPTTMKALSRVRSLRGGVLSLVYAGLPQWAGCGIVHECFKEASLPWVSGNDPEGTLAISPGLRIPEKERNVPKKKTTDTN